MAADVELMPSSMAAFTKALKGERGLLDAWLEVNNEMEVRAHVESYARANVEHHTEALRAEVEAVWAAMPRDARYLDPPDGGCVPLHEQVRRMAADATRAERLVEALQWYVDNDDTNDGQDGNEFWIAGRDRARALLRDQEEGK